MSTRRKIVYMIDSLAPLGGAERMVYELASHMQSDYDVTVIAFDGTAGDYYVDLLDQQGVNVIIIPKELRLFAWRTAKKLVPYLKTLKPDIVHTHLFAADVWGAIAARRAGVPAILSTEHNINHDEGRLKHWLKCYTHAFRQGIAAVSTAVADYVIEECRDAQDKVRMIYNGIDLSQFADIPEKKMLSKPAQLVVVGRLEPQKGHMALLNALRYVKQPVELTIVGEGSLRNMIERKIVDLGLENCVRCVGVQTDMPAVYKQSDIVVMPSLWEGFGLVAIEAMAAGRPVIASNIDGLRELITKKKTGMLVNMDKPDAVARAIDEIIADDGLRTQLVSAGRASVQQKFSIDQMIAEYKKWYTEFL